MQIAIPQIPPDKALHALIGYGAACAATVIGLLAGGGLAISVAAGIAASAVLGAWIEQRQAVLNGRRIEAGLEPQHEVDANDALATLLGGCAFAIPLLSIYAAYMLRHWATS
jgi:hypothetical protein